MNYWIHPDAEAELGDAAVYYAEHASLAIAEAFLAEFERVRDLLAENQSRGPHADHGFRVYHFDRFPYTVVYEENPTPWAPYNAYMSYTLNVPDAVGGLINAGLPGGYAGLGKKVKSEK